MPVVRGSERGGEFAKHGFCRGFETLLRTIDQLLRTDAA
jgi:hypothetical protein